MDQLEGKTAVITGGASGIGLAFANRFAAAGMNIVIGDIEKPALDGAVEAMRSDGASVIGVVCDVADEASNRSLFDASIEAFGGVNVLCLNAGVAGSGRLHEGTTKDWQWTLGVNLWGIIHGVQAFLPHLRDHGDAHIVITASVAGHTAYTGLGPYSVSKHAAVTIAETLQNELTEDGCDVAVTCLCPGLVSTNILKSGRNRPENLRNIGIPELRTEADEVRAAVSQEIFTSAKPPHEVADLVHDAVRAKQFWLFTDTYFEDAIKQRHDEIQTLTNPRLRGSLVEETFKDQ